MAAEQAVAILTALGFAAEVVEAAAAREGWRVTGTLLLSWLPFPSGATYRDLLDNEDLAAAHPAVRALADGRPAGDREFSRPATGPEIGGWTAPDVAPLILAADSAQRACVAAALAGLERAPIIHGLGTGALRDAVREHAATHPLVKGVRPGERGEGGDGATILTF